MSNLETQISVGADSEKVASGLEPGKRALKDFARVASDAGKEASGAIAGIGDGAEPASQKVGSATKRIASEIQRVIAAADAGERGTRKFYESLTAQRGADANFLKPYLDSLDAVKEKQRIANLELLNAAPVIDKIGISAKQTAFAMRGIPAQFTDIVTSLQAGQAPMTVLLQQGGQLKDMFGGVGNAARALGGYIVGLINPVTVLAAGAAAVGYALYKGAEQQRAFQQALIISGNAAGATAAQLDKIYQSVGKATGQFGLSEDVLIALVRGRQVAVAQLQGAAESVVKFSRATGASAKSLVDDLNAVGKDPVKAVLQLQEKYGLLTAATYLQTHALVEQGRQQEAVILVQKRTTEGMDAIGKAAKENQGFIERFWLALKGDAGDAANVIANIGKDISPAVQLAALQKQLAEKQARGPVNDNPAVAASYAKGIANLEALIAKNKALVVSEEAVAQAQGENAIVDERATAGLVRLNAAYDQHMSKGEQLIKQLAELKRAQADALKSPDLGEGDVAVLTKRYAAIVEDVKRQLAPAFSLPALIHSLLIQESGNRQFTDSGQTVVNPKSGATGIAQILPKYLPDYARMAGEDSSLERLKTDPEYGKRLAEGGIKTYLRRFGNDVEKALAAYNYGPANLDKLVGRFGDSYKEHLPQETKKYVKDILGRLPKDQAGDYSDAIGPARATAFDAASVDARKKLAQATAEADAAQRSLTKSQADFEVVQASPVWAQYNATQKEYLTDLAKQAEVQDRIKDSANEGNKIKAQADAQVALNAVYGKSKSAAEEWRLAQLGANAAVAQALGQSPQLVAQLQKTADEQQRYVNALKEADYKTLNEKSNEYARSVNELGKAYADEANLAGLTGVEREKIIVARRIELELAKRQADVDNSSLSDDQKREQRAKLRASADQEIQIGVSKVVADNWIKTADTISGFLTDAFTQSAKAGESRFSTMVKNIRAMFEKMVLNFVVRGTVNAAGQALGLTGASGGAGSGALGLASNASSLNTIYGAGSQALFGGSAGASGASLAYANAVGAVGGDGLGALIAANGSWAGIATSAAAAETATAAIAANTALAAGEGVALAAGTGAAAAGGAAAGGAAAGGAAAGSVGLAAVPVYGWIALAAIAAYALLSGDKKPSSSTGESSINFDAAGKQTADISGTQAQFATFKNAAYDNVVRGLAFDYQTTAKALGITAKEANFGFGGNNGEGGEGKNIAVSGGVIGGPLYQSGEVKDTPENLKLLASRAVLAALEGSELPKYLKGVFDNIDPAKLDQGQVDKVLANAQALKNFNDQLLKLPFANLAELTYTATQALIGAAGGFDALQSKLGSYLQNYYSQEEQRAQTIKNINAATVGSGLDAATATRASFRALVEAQDVTTDAGLKNYAMLLNVADAFATLTPPAESAAAAIENTAQALANVARETQSWQDKLDILTGKFSEREISLRNDLAAASNDTVRDLIRQVYAQEDLAASAKEAAAAVADAAQKMIEARATLLRGNLEAATGAASDAYEALSRAVRAQQTEDAAAYEAQKAIATASFTAQATLLRANIDGVKSSLDAVSQSVGKLKALSGSLKSTLDAMRIAGSEQTYRAGAQAQISGALSTARSGGGLPLDGQLASALATVSKPSEQLFASFEDYARDFYKTANDIAALSGITDSQLTTDEQAQQTLQLQLKSLDDQEKLLKNGFADQISGLDKILENAKRQLDAANGINQSVLSVADAMAAFQTAILALTTERAKQDLPTSRGVDYTSEQIVSAVKTSLQQGFSVNDIYRGAAANFGIGASKITDATDAYGVAGFTKATEQASPKAYSDQQVMDAIKSSLAAGFSIDDVYTGAGRNFGISSAEIARIGKLGNIPGFAAGINYVPQDMTARIHEGEAVIPRAFNPFNPAAGGNTGNTEMLAELKAMRQELADLKKSNQSTADSTKKLASQFDTATEGGRAILTEVYA